MTEIGKHTFITKKGEVVVECKNYITTEDSDNMLLEHFANKDSMGELKANMELTNSLCRYFVVSVGGNSENPIEYMKKMDRLIVKEIRDHINELFSPKE